MNVVTVPYRHAVYSRLTVELLRDWHEYRKGTVVALAASEARILVGIGIARLVS